MNLANWVNDQLHRVLGVSEKHIAEFVLAAANSADSSESLYSQLVSIEFPGTPQTMSFAVELYELHTVAPTVKSEYKQKHEEDLETIRKNQSYALIKTKRDKRQKHLEFSTEEKNQLVSEMRKESRWNYLEQRAPQQLQLMKTQLADEEELFQDVQLSQREINEQRINREIFDLALASNQKMQENANYDLPEDYDDQRLKRFQALTQRCPEDKPELPDSELWEHSQSSRAVSQRPPPAPGYSLLLESQVSFAKAELLSPAMEPTAAAPQSSAVLCLPIHAYKSALLSAIKDYNVLILIGETGSGKTTQVPQYLHQAGYTSTGQIACTQPRRVAAMSVANRVAQELGVKLGHTVGFSVRFEDCTSPKTVLKYLTDGMLLREFMNDPALSNYSVVMIDEAHERTLHTDILFALIKDLARARSADLKVLVSSATLDAEKFARYFDECPLFYIPGKVFPVEVFYTKAPEPDYIEAAVVTVLQIHVTQELGDILVFLTGQNDIEKAQELLLTRTKGLGSKIKELIVLPIYSSLPSESQARIFSVTPQGARKVVLATNIAETSITIDGIHYVIDCGLCKETSYNPRGGMESLTVTNISKASAQQRAGRAGRVAPGKCFRLYTLWSFENELEDNARPEIQRTNISSVVLTLKSIGIRDLVHFDFIDPPPSESLIKALEDLYALGALDTEGELSTTGRRMAEFPVSPMLSRSILKAADYGCALEVLTIAAVLAVGNSVFVRPKDRALHADSARMGFSKPGGDHLALLSVYSQWAAAGCSGYWARDHFVQQRYLLKARDIRDQLLELCRRVGLAVNTVAIEDEALILKSFCAGFFFNAGTLGTNGLYKTVRNSRTVHMHPSSVLFKEMPRWIVYNDLVLTSKEFMRNVVQVNVEWLREAAPHYFKEGELEDNKKLPRGRVVVTQP